jgi:hypothetical protein
MTRTTLGMTRRPGIQQRPGNVRTIVDDTIYIWVTHAYGIIKLRASDLSTVFNIQLSSETYAEGGIGPPVWDGKNIWVTLKESTGTKSIYLAKINGTTGEVSGIYQPNETDSGLGESCVVGEYLWVVDGPYDCIIKVRISDGSVIAKYTAEFTPSSICYDGSYIWVSLAISEALIKVDPANGAILATYSISSIGRVCFDGTYIWASIGLDTVKKISRTDGSVLGTYTVVEGYSGSCYDLSGNVWFTGSMGGNIYKVRSSDGEVINSFNTGTYPTYVASDGTNIWVGENVLDNAKVYKYRISDCALVGSYQLATVEGYTTYGYGGVCVTKVYTSPIAIITSSLSNGTVGSAYSALLSATGGVGVLTWTLDSGSVPTGLNLASSGVLSGTCSAAGTFSFVAKATDSTGQTSTVSLNMTAVNNITIPTTAAECVDRGWASPTALWLCDETSGNLVDEVGGIAVVPEGAPLQNQDFVGIAGKKCIDTSGTNVNRGFRCATSGPADIGTGDFTLSFLVHTISGALPANPTLLSKLRGDNFQGYMVRSTSTAISLWTSDGVTSYEPSFTHALYNGSTHLVTFAADRDGLVSLYLDKLATETASSKIEPHSISNIDRLSIGMWYGYGRPFQGQIAWVYFNNGTADGRTGHDALCAALGIT